MKKILYIVVLFMLFSCESYLDVPREALDITNQDVWGKYANAKTFTTKLYPDIITFSNQHAVGIGTGDNKRAGFPNIASNQLRIYGDVDWERVNFDEPNFSQTFCNMGSAWKFRLFLYWT